MSPVRSPCPQHPASPAGSATPHASSAGVSARSSDEMFALGKLPRAGPERWKYLDDADNWCPERRSLHDRLIDDAFRKASVFAEAVERSGRAPTLFAMRGNTASGKTWMARSALPVLAGAMKESGGGCINPDVFKVRLGQARGQPEMTPAHLHAESCVLADRLERRLSGLKTASGRPASMLVDKRLGGAHEVAHHIKLAEETGRKIELHDIDTPLQHSLLRVLQRTPGGDAPRPPYAAVRAGFSDIRGNRPGIIDKFLASPRLGTYHLYGTSLTDAKVPVATVVNGELTLHDPDKYEEIMDPADASPGDIGDRKIDDETIRQLTARMPPATAAIAREALKKYAGMSWSAALQAHSELK